MALNVSPLNLSAVPARTGVCAPVPSTTTDRGDERVLDVGCGLGRMTVCVAKRLTTGRVIGIDVWDRMEIPGNSPERAHANAQIEGVHDKIEFRTGDVRSIPFPDDSFEAVTSSSVINNLHGDPEKVKALTEIHRVLRPGGKFLLLEPLRDSWEGALTFTPFFAWTLLTKDRWITLLKRTGFVNLRHDHLHGMGAFLTEKPARHNIARRQEARLVMVCQPLP